MFPTARYADGPLPALSTTLSMLLTVCLNLLRGARAFAGAGWVLSAQLIKPGVAEQYAGLYLHILHCQHYGWDCYEVYVLSQVKAGQNRADWEKSG